MKAQALRTEVIKKINSKKLIKVYIEKIFKIDNYSEQRTYKPS